MPLPIRVVRLALPLAGAGLLALLVLPGGEEPGAPDARPGTARKKSEIAAVTAETTSAPEVPARVDAVVESPVAEHAPRESGSIASLLARLAELEAAVHAPGVDRRRAVGEYRTCLADAVAVGPELLDDLGAHRCEDLDSVSARQAIAVAAGIGGSGAVRLIAHVLDGSCDPAVGLASAEALGRLGGPDAAAAVHRAFVSGAGDPHRYRFAQLLGQLGDRVAADDLAAAANDLDPSVRVAALAAVARIDPDRARPLAEAQLGDGDETVRREAARLLESELRDP